MFTPEDFSEQHQLIGQTAEEFAINEIVPNIEKIEHKDFSVTRDLLKKAGELGLSSVEIPEAYGGLEMDKVTAAVIADHIAKYAGFATTWGGHTGIGTLPIVYFGTEEQKKKYLPRLGAGEIVGAYALSESTSGSDALNCRTRAVLSPDGKHYILNGEKMWITNAGFADLFTVFAKIDGEKFSAFLVEKTFPGFSVGAEEHKMGIRGSSTCPIILNDCKVPVENLLGETWQGTSDRLQHPEYRTLQAGRDVCRRRASLTGKRHRLCQAAKSVQQDHRRFRTGARKDRQYGDTAVCRRVAGLSHGRHDGFGVSRKSTNPRQTLRSRR